MAFDVGGNPRRALYETKLFPARPGRRGVGRPYRPSHARQPQGEKLDASTLFRQDYLLGLGVPACAYGREDPTSDSCDDSSQLIVPPPIIAGSFIVLFTMWCGDFCITW